MYGKELKLKRKFLGLSQDELAERVGVTKQAISAYENSKAIPNKPTDKVIDQEIGKAFVEWDITKQTLIGIRV